jgi:hypothetical protein
MPFFNVRSRRYPGYFGGYGFLQPWASQMGKGLPSARPGRAADVTKTANAAKTRRNRFTVLLLLRKNSHRDTLHAEEVEFYQE